MAAQAGSPPSGDTDPNALATYWLEQLRDGTPDQQAQARTELGLILEQRGQLEEAAEAYYANVKARVSDRRPYERLAAISRQRGEDAYAAKVLAQLDKVHRASDLHQPSRRSRTVVGLLAAASVLVAVGFVIVNISTKPSSGPLSTPTVATRTVMVTEPLPAPTVRQTVPAAGTHPPNPDTEIAANLPLNQGPFNYCSDPWGRGLTCQIISPAPWNVPDVGCQWGQRDDGTYWSSCGTRSTSGQTASCDWNLRTDSASSPTLWSAGCVQRYGGLTNSAYWCEVDIHPNTVYWRCRRLTSGGFWSGSL